MMVSRIDERRECALRHFTVRFVGEVFTNHMVITPCSYRVLKPTASARLGWRRTRAVIYV